MPPSRLLMRLAVLAVVSVLSVRGAQGEDVSAVLADGKPSHTTGPNGRPMSLTFSPDGTVRMQMGILSRRMTWTPSAEGVCLKGGPGGDRCLRLERTAQGFIGHDGDRPPLTLSR